jgi:two-component sensor histidine kinase
MGKGDFNIECRAITPAGETRWIEIRAQTKYDAHGDPISMTGVSMDITERKDGEAHRQLLVQELGHRIKNTLATVQSIVSQSVRGSDASNDLATLINQRIDALGGAHDILVGRGLDRAKLLETVARALKPFRGEGGRINILGRDDVELSSRANTALTMALHELATNAVKYGALSNEAGYVEVGWSLTGEQFVLTWQEFGGPAVIAPTRTGFGSRMIERALASTLGGPAKLDYLPSGVRFELRTDRSHLGDGLSDATSGAKFV